MAGKISTTAHMVSKFKDTHGDTYDYSKVDYKGRSVKVIIVCPTHGEFSQAPSNHVRGQGCRLWHPYFRITRR